MKIDELNKIAESKTISKSSGQMILHQFPFLSMFSRNPILFFSIFKSNKEVLNAFPKLNPNINSSAMKSSKDKAINEAFSRMQLQSLLYNSEIDSKKLKKSDIK